VRCTADDAPYLSNWFTPYPHSTSLHLNLWQRFVNSFVIPAQIMASMWQPMQQLNKVKQECGIKIHAGSPAKRHAHSLKIINGFFGFEVGCVITIDPVCLMMTRQPIWSYPAFLQQFLPVSGAGALTALSPG
jgi:hypothetical protein